MAKHPASPFLRCPPLLFAPEGALRVGEERAKHRPTSFSPQGARLASYAELLSSMIGVHHQRSEYGFASAEAIRFSDACGSGQASASNIWRRRIAARSRIETREPSASSRMRVMAKIGPGPSAQRHLPRLPLPQFRSALYAIRIVVHIIRRCLNATCEAHERAVLR